MNKGKMGLGASKEGFLEAVAWKERRDPAPNSQCQKTLAFRGEPWGTCRGSSIWGALLLCLPAAVSLTCNPPRVVVPSPPQPLPQAGARFQRTRKLFLSSFQVLFLQSEPLPPSWLRRKNSGHLLPMLPLGPSAVPTRPRAQASSRPEPLNGFYFEKYQIYRKIEDSVISIPTHITLV